MQIVLKKGEHLIVRFTEEEVDAQNPVDMDGDLLITHGEDASIKVSTTWPDDTGREREIYCVTPAQGIDRSRIADREEPGRVKDTLTPDTFKGVLGDVPEQVMKDIEEKPSSEMTEEEERAVGRARQARHPGLFGQQLHGGER